MDRFIEIHWTSGSLDEARKVCRYLVQERMVACAQIIPWIESTYLWDGQLQNSQESKIVLKTMLKRFDQIKEVILCNCRYEIPEITATTIEKGNAEYLQWIEDTVEFKIASKQD